MKKFLSAVLALSMLMSIMTYSMYAYKYEDTSNMQLTEVDQIEAERKKLHESVKEQLIVQDSLYLMDYFDSVIDNMLSTKYGTITRAEGSKFYAPHGGWSIGKTSNVDIEAQFYDIQDTQKLYNARNDKSLLRTLLENIPTYIGKVLSLGLMCDKFAKENMWKNIDVGKEGCCFYGAYDSNEMKTTTVIMSWQPPYMSVSSSVTVLDHGVR